MILTEPFGIRLFGGTNQRIGFCEPNGITAFGTHDQPSSVRTFRVMETDHLVMRIELSVYIHRLSEAFGWRRIIMC